MKRTDTQKINWMLRGLIVVLTLSLMGWVSGGVRGFFSYNAPEKNSAIELLFNELELEQGEVVSQGEANLNIEELMTHVLETSV